MQRKNLLILLALLVVLLLSACTGASGEAMINVEQIQTMAVMTYQAQLTQTALAIPTNTPTPNITPEPVITFSTAESSATAPATSTTNSDTGAADCYNLSYVRDVTIPDGTKMKVGQAFTKTWLVTNSGTCDWEVGFKFNVVAGDPMNAVAVTLNQVVQPGRQFEFSVPMVAPTDKSGELKGIWRLSDLNDNFFGDGVYVLIDIVGGPTATPSETPTLTP